ncbi:MAG: hypothetical protein EOO75_09165 [Myxococcales bacterium]|nr:MAG: hypothetical protein EOO75_09165 [Myxococcales bacterium]
MPSADRTIHFVWIGQDALGPLGVFNILSWLSVGWSVTVTAHPCEAQASRRLFRSIQDPAVARLVAGAVSVRALGELIGDPARRRVMPRTCGAIGELLGRDIPRVGYAIGDLTKPLIAGTERGVVLDLKIGPSPHIAAFPAEPFGDFVSTSRRGALVENQCMGSFDLGRSGAYGAEFDRKINLDSIRGGASGEVIFPGLTAAHTGAFGKIRGRVVNEVADAQRTWVFRELYRRLLDHDVDASIRSLRTGSPAGAWEGPVVNGHGPFRVYQIAGFFNWKAGPTTRQENGCAVAYTLWRDFGAGAPPADHPDSPALPLVTTAYRAEMEAQVTSYARSLLLASEERPAVAPAPLPRSSEGKVERREA